MEFCLNPPKDWIGSVVRNRFLPSSNSPDGERCANPKWRPFSTTSTKHLRICHAEVNVRYAPSQGSISQVFSVSSSLYEYAIDEGMTSINPFKAIKQKSKYKTRNLTEKTTRAWSPLQWDYVLTTAESMAESDPINHERTLFISATLFSMYLRVSDMCGRDNWQPTMGSFRADHDGNWWFHVVGKGNKAAKIAVRPEYIDCYLTRYRQFLGLSPLPLPGESTPLLSRLDGPAV